MKEREMSTIWLIIIFSIGMACLFLFIVFKSNEGSIGKYHEMNQDYNERYKRMVAEQEAKNKSAKR